MMLILRANEKLRNIYREGNQHEHAMQSLWMRKQKAENVEKRIIMLVSSVVAAQKKDFCFHFRNIFRCSCSQISRKIYEQLS